ncbi:MAG: hypothetical protein WHS87_01610 [Anaerolineales bacterium]
MTKNLSSHSALWAQMRRINRGLVWGVILILALLAFEIFNFSTTQFALLDMLGDLKFAGMRWATILAIAFCGIDFAGIARIFTPEQGRDEPKEVWYLFGAWLLAALFNAGLTWWGVSVAIAGHRSLGTAVVSNETMLKVIPILVALMVWLTRVLLIGTFAMAGERLFTLDTRVRPSAQGTTANPAARPSAATPRPAAGYSATVGSRPTSGYNRPEPTYHNLSAQGRSPEGRPWE